MTERSDEVVKAFDDDNCAALASCEVCGLINEDLFPGSQDFGPSAAETVNHTHDNDPLLQQHLLWLLNVAVSDLPLAGLHPRRVPTQFVAA